MAVVCEKGLKNKNIPINMGTLIINISKNFSFEFFWFDFNALSMNPLLPITYITLELIRKLTLIFG